MLPERCDGSAPLQRDRISFDGAGRRSAARTGGARGGGGADDRTATRWRAERAAEYQVGAPAERRRHSGAGRQQGEWTDGHLAPAPLIG